MAATTTAAEVPVSLDNQEPSTHGPSRRFAAVQHAVGFQTYRVGVLISFSDFPLSGVFRALTRRAEIVDAPDPVLPV